MLSEVERAAAEGAYIAGAVALKELKEKDEAIERLEEEAELLRARVDELAPPPEEI